jgi:hypothetical protein
VAVVLGMVLPEKSTSPLQKLKSLLIPVSFDNGTALQTPLTPQNNALNWLANNTHLDSYLDAKKIQRYALATLFFSTNGTSWNREDSSISDDDECGWYNNEASLCTRGSIETLSLSENNLVGTIPNELALLSNLGESSVVWLLVVMIVWSCVFFIVLSGWLVMFILQLHWISP